MEDGKQKQKKKVVDEYKIEQYDKNNFKKEFMNGRKCEDCKQESTFDPDIGRCPDNDL